MGDLLGLLLRPVFCRSLALRGSEWKFSHCHTPSFSSTTFSLENLNYAIPYICIFMLSFCLSWTLHIRANAQCNPVRDQGQIFDTTGIIFIGAEVWSQSITTGFPGQLAGIQFQIENPSQLPADVSFWLYDGGNPTTGQPLYTQQLTLTSADLEGPGLYTWDLTSPNYSITQVMC